MDFFFESVTIISTFLVWLIKLPCVGVRNTSVLPKTSIKLPEASRSLRVFAESVFISSFRLSARCFGMQVTSAPVSSLTVIRLLLILGSLNFDTVH